MDEALFNIDFATEERIRALIEQEFRSSTLITIAQRVSTIVKSDKVLVMDEGEVVDYDTPKALHSKDEQSMYKELLKEIREKRQRNN